MRVRNINGTSDNTCRCGSWLEHWKTFSQHRAGDPVICPVENCGKPATDGAHVQRDLLGDRRWYIVPLCSEHNQKVGQELRILDVTELVSANVSETCGGYRG